MLNFRIICPLCGAVVITPSPRAVALERCPGCKLHIWDLYDALMADIYIPGQDSGAQRNFHAEN